MSKITILGSGSWGTAMAVVLSGNGHDVTLASVHKNSARLLKKARENPRLPGVALPEHIRFSEGFEDARGADAVVIATPSFAVRKTAGEIKHLISPGALIVSASKGIEAATSLRMSEVICQETGAADRIVALSGPSHAEEVGRGFPTGCVAASLSLAAAETAQDMFMSSAFRVYSSDDIIGVELCGAFKNIIAICAGISIGVGYGDNTIAMLMTRGLSEIASLGAAMGGRRETFAGLAGIGDIIVTCTSRHSRNRSAGILIGQGLSAEEAMQEIGATVEGYYATKAALSLAEKTGVDMPISTEAYRVLYEGKPPHLAVKDLMQRGRKTEFSDGTWLGARG